MVKSFGEISQADDRELSRNPRVVRELILRHHKESIGNQMFDLLVAAKGEKLVFHLVEGECRSYETRSTHFITQAHYEKVAEPSFVIPAAPCVPPESIWGDLKAWIRKLCRSYEQVN